MSKIQRKENPHIQRNEIENLSEHLQFLFHSCIIHNTHDEEQNCSLTDKRLQNLHIGIQFTLITFKRCLVTYNNTHEPGRNYEQRNEPDRERHKRISLIHEIIENELMAAESEMVATKGIEGEAGIAMRLAKDHTVSVTQVK